MNSNNTQSSSDPVERLLRQAEISRITRTLKTKLASASLETRLSPMKTPERLKPRRRAKTMEGNAPVQMPFTNTTPVGSRKLRNQNPRPVSAVQNGNESWRYASNAGSPRNHNLRHASSYQSLNNSSVSKSSPSSGVLLTPENRVRNPVTPALSLTAAPDMYDEPLPREPQTPPPSVSDGPKTPIRDPKGAVDDGANLLLHFAASPGRTGTPKTPDFNMGEYLNLQTPSPAKTPMTPRRMQWTSLNSALFGQTPFRS